MPTIHIEGMTCEHCIVAVEGALGRVEGVAAVQVDLIAGTATFSEERPVSMTEVRQALEETGYRLTQG